MDFLVAGLGFGALLVLAGYATREFGVFLFVPGRIRKAFADNAELAASWRGLCRVAANVAMIGGLVMWLALVVAIALSLSDQAGAYLVASVATALSAAGAALIVLKFTRMHQPAQALHPDTSVAAAGWLESDVLPEESTEPFESWKPRIIPKSVAAMESEMPTWGAVVEHPLPDEAASASVAAQAPVTSAIEAPTDERPVEVAASTVVEPVSAAEPPVEAEQSIPEKIQLEPTDSTSESAEPADEVEADDSDIATLETNPADVVVETESLAAPDDEGTLADVVVEPRVEETGSRRFKSSLLSNLDEPGAVDVNAKFKSSILADLSAVRLPDDGPRFRSTTLVDLASPEEAEVDSSQTNGSANHRR